MRVDLHLHTTASDGQHSPSEIVAMAHRIGLNVIAITDHDTTDGLAPAIEAGRELGLRVIPGIELSAEDDAGDVHMLGYFMQPDTPALQAKLRDFREKRYDRGQIIVDKLAAMGMPLRWERIVELAQSGKRPGSIGRPHIARAMVEAGYVESVKEAFDLYISNDGPAYAPRARLTPEEAIALIHSAGGAAVLAHPGLLPEPIAMIDRLAPAGLDGVEITHPKNSETVRLNARAAAARHGLLITGGSDFHGTAVSMVMMGAETPPEGCVAALEQRASAIRSAQ